MTLDSKLHASRGQCSMKRSSTAIKMMRESLASDLSKSQPSTKVLATDHLDRAANTKSCTENVWVQCSLHTDAFLQPFTCTVAVVLHDCML